MDNAVRPISIHALREEGDLRRHRLPQTAANHFYPRPPRGGRPAGVRRAVVADVISIRALREEGDRPQAQVQSKADNFYPRPPRGGRRSAPSGRRSNSAFLSTPSARRATRLCVDVVHHGVAISIHALREEGDAAAARATARPANFYPRPPRGGRHIDEINDHIHKLFLSTPSARRATPLPASGCFLR